MRDGQVRGYLRRDEEDWYTSPEDGVHKPVASLRYDREAWLRLEEDLEKMRIDLPGGGLDIALEPDHPQQLPKWVDFPPGAIFGVLAFEPW